MTVGEKAPFIAVWFIFYRLTCLIANLNWAETFYVGLFIILDFFKIIKCYRETETICSIALNAYIDRYTACYTMHSVPTLLMLCRASVWCYATLEKDSKGRLCITYQRSVLNLVYRWIVNLTMSVRSPNRLELGNMRWIRWRGREPRKYVKSCKLFFSVLSLLHRFSRSHLQARSTSQQLWTHEDSNDVDTVCDREIYFGFTFPKNPSFCCQEAKFSTKLIRTINLRMVIGRQNNLRYCFLQILIRELNGAEVPLAAKLVNPPINDH